MYSLLTSPFLTAPGPVSNQAIFYDLLAQGLNVSIISCAPFCDEHSTPRSEERSFAIPEEMAESGICHFDLMKGLLPNITLPKLLGLATHRINMTQRGLQPFQMLLESDEVKSMCFITV